MSEDGVFPLISGNIFSSIKSQIIGPLKSQNISYITQTILKYFSECTQKKDFFFKSARFITKFMSRYSGYFAADEMYKHNRYLNGEWSHGVRGEWREERGIFA